eukprot:g2525.t1
MDSPLSAPRYGGKRKARTLGHAIKKHRNAGPRLRVPRQAVEVRRKPTSVRRSGLCITFNKPDDYHLLTPCGGSWDCRVRWKDANVKPQHAQVWLSGGDVQYIPKRDVLQFSSPAQKCFELGGLYTFECLAFPCTARTQGDHISPGSHALKASETQETIVMWTIENVRMCDAGSLKAAAAEKERRARQPPPNLGRTLLPARMRANGGIVAEFWLPHERLDALRSGTFYYQVGYRTGCTSSWITQAASGEKLAVRLSPAAEREGDIELQGENDFHNRKVHCMLLPAGGLQPGTAYDFATRLVHSDGRVVRQPQNAHDEDGWGKPWSCLIEERVTADRSHELGQDDSWPTTPTTPLQPEAPAPGGLPATATQPASPSPADAPQPRANLGSAPLAAASVDAPPVCFAVTFDWAKRHELIDTSAAKFLLRAGNEGWPELARRLDYRASHPPIGVLQLCGAHDEGAEARVLMRDQSTHQVILDHAFNTGTVVEFGAGDETGSCGCVCYTPPSWNTNETAGETGDDGGCYFLYFTDCRNAVSFHNAVTSLSFHSAITSLRAAVEE